MGKRAGGFAGIRRGCSAPCSRRYWTAPGSVGHRGMPYDKTTVQLVLDALDSAQAQHVPCWQGFPL
jgi:hypothetical protein